MGMYPDTPREGMDALVGQIRDLQRQINELRGSSDIGAGLLAATGTATITHSWPIDDFGDVWSTDDPTGSVTFTSSTGRFVVLGIATLEMLNAMGQTAFDIQADSKRLAPDFDAGGRMDFKDEQVGSVICAVPVIGLPGRVTVTPWFQASKISFGPPTYVTFTARTTIVLPF